MNGPSHPAPLPPHPTALRIVVAEDALLLREGLQRMLSEAGFDVVGTAADATDLLSQVDELRPDVVLVDIRMPPTQTTEGLEAARRIRHSWPGIAVVVMSQHVETQHVVELLEDDPRGLGYILKDQVADLAQFTDTIRRVAKGESVIDPTVVARLVGRPRRVSPLQHMTERDRASSIVRPAADRRIVRQRRNSRDQGIGVGLGGKAGDPTLAATAWRDLRITVEQDDITATCRIHADIYRCDET